jgi:hypothetical protein
MAGDRKIYGLFMGNPEGKDHSEDRGVDEKMESKWV